MRMPGKSIDIMLWNIRSEIVQYQKWVERGDLAEPKSSLKVDTGSLNCRFALQDLGYLPSFNHFFTILTSTYLLSTDLDCEHGNRASVYAIYRKTDLLASFFAAYDIE